MRGSRLFLPFPFGRIARGAAIAFVGELLLGCSNSHSPATGSGGQPAGGGPAQNGGAPGGAVGGGGIAVGGGIAGMAGTVLGGAGGSGANAVGGLAAAGGNPSVGGAGGGAATGGNTALGGNISGPDTTGAPTGLLTALTRHPELTALTVAKPTFAWIVNTPRLNERQSAFQILVASSQQILNGDTGDLWDSGKTTSATSINVPYAGKALAPSAICFWKVRTWDSTDAASPWSSTQSFVMAAKLGQYSTARPSVVQTPVAPVTVAQLGTGKYFLDFGRDAFGWLELTIDAPADGAIVNMKLGEKSTGQAVDMAPGGSIRAEQGKVTLQKGSHTYRVETRNFVPGVALPAALGVVMPFRYVEVSNSPVVLTTASASQIALAYPFDHAPGAFTSSNATLNQVWELSRYTLGATTFDDVYIDGDRERTPYEADAYIQQLGHYAIDRDYALARYSHEYLMTHATWPTEWKFHSVMMAWADWMYTGNTESLAQQYASLKSQKTLESLVGADGLLNTAGQRDIVDWPGGERDGYVFTDVNTVVNAFWCHLLGLMADIAAALGNTADATRYRGMATIGIAALNSKLFSPTSGLYIDGATSTHTSLHANLFPLAFGLVPADRQAAVITFVKSKGMACSVYGAQYLLEGLYQAGQADAALALLTSTTDRSWMNMIKVGSTMTTEAWDMKYKPNLTWNHAWGAAPANIIPRYILGVRPLSAGFAQAVIAPQPGSLAHIEGTVATIRGSIRVVVDTAPLTMTVTIPANMTANVAIPPTAAACTVMLDGNAAQTTAVGGVSWINAVGSGQHVVRCQ